VEDLGKRSKGEEKGVLEGIDARFVFVDRWTLEGINDGLTTRELTWFRAMFITLTLNLLVNEYR
jgi:hypothetical protein